MADGVMDREVLDRLITRADVDGLIGLVDQLGTAGDWEGLATTAERVPLGGEHRASALAGDGPRRVPPRAGGAGAVGRPRAGGGRRPVLPRPAVGGGGVDPRVGRARSPRHPGPLRSFVAHERVLRGEDLRGADVDAQVLDLPLVVAPWEPAYPLADYQTTEATFPSPDRPALQPVTLRTPGRSGRRRRGGRRPPRPRGGVAARLQRPGRHRRRRGRPRGRHRRPRRAGARVAEVEAGEAMAWMAWAAASGGAHGRRPGLAHGRFAAWWAVASLLGIRDDWPLDPEDLGSAASELRWFLWDAYEPVTGWQLQVAVWDPADGLAWAISARDQA